MVAAPGGRTPAGCGHLHSEVRTTVLAICSVYTLFYSIIIDMLREYFTLYQEYVHKLAEKESNKSANMVSTII